MHLATLRLEGGETSAAVENSHGWVALRPFRDVGDLLTVPHWEALTHAHLESSDSETIDVPVDFAPIVRWPRKVICCGLNYRTHLSEMGRPEPEYPTLFTKFADTLTGAGDTIIFHPEADGLDWEAELAIVVGLELTDAAPEQAAAAIAGYTVANDFSVRTWQYHTGQWLPGKACTASTPLGPVLVTTDEIGPRDALTITCTVNGEIVQSARIDDLLFSPEQLLSYISRFTTLRPGDVVLTGTPGGVGAGCTPPRYLRAGDIVETRIDSIGLLRNSIQIQNASEPDGPSRFDA